MVIKKVSVRQNRAGKYSGYLAGRKVADPTDKDAALEWLVQALLQPKRELSRHSVFAINDVMCHLARSRNKVS